MREIKYIIIHCTAGNPNATIQDLKLVFKNRGWKEVGYHKVVHLDGKVTTLRNDNVITNGVQNYNRNSLHIVYLGGIDMKTLKPKDTRTKEQKEALKKEIGKWLKLYPKAKVHGHNDLAPKACPSFKVTEKDWK